MTKLDASYTNHICEPTSLESCDIYAGYTGQLNNLDYIACIEQEYGFCGTEYYQALEGARSGDNCYSTSFLLPRVTDNNDRKTHYST